MIEQQQQLLGIIGVIGSEFLAQRLFPIIDIEGRQQKRRVGMELDVAAGVLERLGHGQKNAEEQGDSLPLGGALNAVSAPAICSN